MTALWNPSVWQPSVAVRCHPNLIRTARRRDNTTYLLFVCCAYVAALLLFFISKLDLCGLHARAALRASPPRRVRVPVPDMVRDATARAAGLGAVRSFCPFALDGTSLF